jgi:hypothetical protein
MRSILIRLYPARWRERYGDEFEVILEERPLGPFDVADIILGAIDARIRLRGRGTAPTHGRSLSMSLRIGGYAAVLGGATLATSILLGLGLVVVVEPVVPGVLLITGSALLLVALAGLSAFQARAHPILSWAAVAAAGVGMIVCIFGVVGMQVLGDGYWDVFIVGIIGVLAGSTMFAIATFWTAALSRGAAALIAASAVLTIIAGFGGDRLPPVLLILTATGFALGWLVLGIIAVRMDHPSTAPRPA